jgi:hypothetical protein
MSVGDHGLRQGYRGTWTDDRTFMLEYDNIANNDHAMITASFQGDRMQMTVQETAHETAVEVTGKSSGD